MLRLPRHPAVWLSAWCAWCALLWVLSSFPNPAPPVPGIQADKLLHFLYFSGGGILFTGWRFHLHRGTPDWKTTVMAAVIIMALIGLIDEWHQCYTPGRSGGDPWDWLADLLGAAAGTFAVKKFHPRL